MPYTIRTKTVSYDGHIFRSLSEARYAHIWNSLGLNYLFEAQMYEFDLSLHSNLRKTHPSGTVKYIPDFELEGPFIEVKGTFPTHKECIKAFLLAQQTKRTVDIVWNTKKLQRLHFAPDGSVRLGLRVQLCTVCDHCNLFLPPCECALYSSKHKKLRDAIQAAMQYRFKILLD